MRSSIVFILFVLSVSLPAQTKSPRGVYQLVKLMDKTGKMVLPFDQYKVCNEDSHYDFAIESATAADIYFVIGNISLVPLNYTGPVKDGDASRSVHVYDSNEKGFVNVWFSEYKNHLYFPENDWCTEYYEANNFSPNASRIFSIITKSTFGKENAIWGCWHRIGIVSSPNTANNVKSCYPDMYDIFDSNGIVSFVGSGQTSINSTHTYSRSLPNINGCYYSVQYPDKNSIQYKNGNHATISWINDNKIIINYNNSNEYYLYERSQIPDPIKITSQVHVEPPLSSSTAVLLPSISFNGLKYKTDDPNYLISAVVKSGTSLDLITISINGSKEKIENITTSDDGGVSFEQQIELQEGMNSVVVEVQGKNGNSSSSLNIEYIPIQHIPNQKRIALVVGNGKYEVSGELANPGNDAKDISAKLESLGFTVLTRLDCDQEQLEYAIKEFGEKSSSYDVALFYYAGHGIQRGGENYLVPVNAEILDAEQLKYKCTPVGYVMDKLGNSKCKAKIIVLDACRNNPLGRAFSRDLSAGLTAVNSMPKGTFIAYSTAPGAIASDGKGRNSPFAEAMLQILDKPGVTLNEFFDEVREAVASKTGQLQTPWISSGLVGKFYFNTSQK